MSNLKIICPSKGRADNVLTTKFIREMIILVPHGEGKAYREHNPDFEVIETPVGLHGITRTKQWMIDNWDEWFSIDDDVIRVTRQYESTKDAMQVTDPDEVVDIIQRLRDMAVEMGAFMYGFNHYRQPELYNAHKPFSHTGYLNSSHFGLLPGHNLYYNLDMLEAEDHWISLLNAYTNRFFLKDHRYAFATKDNFKAKGGCNDYRTSESMVDNTILLRKQFGEAVVLKEATSRKKIINKGERSLKVPF